MSEEIKTGDYTSFDDAKSSIVKFTSEITSENDNIQTNLNKISSSDIFAGPILESAEDGLAKLNGMIEQTKSSFGSVASNLGQASSNYQVGDKAADKTIIGGVET